MRGCVVIPAYNEEKKIGRIIREVKAKGLDCVVIDDGSSDKTKLIAEAEGANVILHAANSGKGASLRDGFKYAVDGGYDFIITMDGDGQHNPEEIEKFINSAKEGKVEVILGNRMCNPKGMPLQRRLTNWFMSLLISAIAGRNIPDSQCGFRLMSTSAIRAISLTTDNYEIESEVLVKAARSGFRIGSVPIESIYVGEKSQIHPIVDTIRFIRFIFKAGFKR